MEGRCGVLREELLGRTGGSALRRRIIEMPNPEYQRLLRCTAGEMRVRLPGDGPDAGTINQLVAEIDDRTLLRAISNPGGAAQAAMRAAYSPIDGNHPTIVMP